MESIFLYFGIGLALFGIELITNKTNKTIRMLAYLKIGFLTGCLLGVFTGVPMTPYIPLPWLATGIMGSIAGLLIYLTQNGKWLSKPGFQYVASILLGLIQSALCYGFIHLYVVITKQSGPIVQDIILSPSTFILLGYIMIFGYTFPKRFFIQHSEKGKSEIG